MYICLLGMCLLAAGWTQGCGTEQLCLLLALRYHFSLTVFMEFVNTHIHAEYNDALKLIAVQGAASVQLHNGNLPAPWRLGWYTWSSCVSKMYISLVTQILFQYSLHKMLGHKMISWGIHRHILENEKNTTRAANCSQYFRWGQGRLWDSGYMDERY